HARPETACRRRGLPRRCTDALSRGAGGDGANGPSSDRRQRRTRFRARTRLQNRGRLEYRALEKTLVGMETANRSEALSRSAKTRGCELRSSKTNGGRRLDRPAAHLRNDQLRWDQCERRDLRRDDHQRLIVENSWAGRRLTDSWCRSIREWRGWCCWLNWARRSQSL